MYLRHTYLFTNESCKIPHTEHYHTKQRIKRAIIFACKNNCLSRVNELRKQIESKSYFNYLCTDCLRTIFSQKQDQESLVKYFMGTGFTDYYKIKRSIIRGLPFTVNYLSRDDLRLLDIFIYKHDIAELHDKRYSRYFHYLINKFGSIRIFDAEISYHKIIQDTDNPILLAYLKHLPKERLSGVGFTDKQLFWQITGIKPPK